MNLIFRKGYKNWETTYEVEFDFEYTSDLKKRITDVIFYCHGVNQGIRIPWDILEEFLNGKTEGLFANACGLKIKNVDGEIHISNGHSLDLPIHKDQMIAIRLAAKKIVEDVSTSVENILTEFITDKSQL